MSGNGIFNDGYGLYVAYKTSAGHVTIEPQAFMSLTNLPTAWGPASPNTFGAIVGYSCRKSKISLSGFYTSANDTLPNTSPRLTTTDTCSESRVSPDRLQPGLTSTGPMITRMSAR